MIRQFSGLLLAVAVAVLPLKAQSVSSLLTTDTGLKSGYVVVTPASGNIAAITGYETIGNMQSAGFQTTIVPPPTLTTSAAVVLDLSTGQNSVTGPAATSGTTLKPSTVTANGSAPSPLFDNTSISIINLNTTPATVHVSITNQGTPMVLPDLPVGPMQQVSLFVNQLLGTSAIPLPVTGILSLNSDLPVAVTAFQFRGSDFVTLPVTITGTPLPLPQMTGTIGGPGALLLPQFLVGGTFASRIIVANVTNSPQNVRVDLFTDAGAPLTTVLNGQAASTV